MPAGSTLKGMTWRHRRAIEPLLAATSAFRAVNPDIEITWDARPLHGFEFTSIAELARRYDLIVLDHPFVGEIAASGCLMPLEEHIHLDDGEFVGPSLATYRYAGHLWAAPVDAACQVAALRPDLLARLDADIPKCFGEVLELGRRAARVGLKLAIAMAGVHGLMTFFTLCAAAGRPCGGIPKQPLCDRETGHAALDLMRAILAWCPAEALDWNSIALHESLVARDDLVYCPAVYCYATYAEADMRRPLRFTDLPAIERDGEPRGSTVGGAGIGVSVSAPEAAVAFARYLMEESTQRLFAEHHGQPARIEPWRDAEIDARFGGAFSGMIRTMELAWVRPRYRGYLGFQAEGGRLIEAHLRGEIAEPDLLDRLERLHSAAGKGG